MDIFCRLGGNPICKNLQYSSNPQISYCQQLNCRYNNTVLRTIGWDYHNFNNSMSPLNYHRRVVFHIYFHHHSIKKKIKLKQKTTCTQKKL